MLDTTERETTVTFEPTDDYLLADVDDTVKDLADDCFIKNFEDALTLWGIQYTRDEKAVPIAVQRLSDKDDNGDVPCGNARRDFV